jgi:nitrous oxidase accessory protein NosD
MKGLLVFCIIVVLAEGALAYEFQVGSGQEYATIKLAMLAASNGDTITVHDGNYAGRVIIDKEVLLRSVNGYEHTFIQADTLWASPLDIYADNVVVEGFSVFGATSASGISVHGVSGVEIRNNRSGWDASHNNRMGIQLYSNAGVRTEAVTISGNICSFNNEGGIYVNSNYHVVENNICNYNQSSIYDGIAGITTYATEGCTIKGNICRGNDIGLKYSYNSAMDVIVDNELSSNTQYGLHAYFQQYQCITGNRIEDNGTAGIYLNGVYYARFWSNTLSGNTVGVDARNCSEIGFHLNSFSDATKFLHTGNSNFYFRSPTMLCYTYNHNTYKGWMGNFYDDLVGEDEDGNGISDSTYPMDDYVDTMPLIVPREEFNLQVWFLHDLWMYRNNEVQSAKQHYLQGAGDSHIWIADGAVVDGMSYPAGTEEDQSTWTGMFEHYNFDSHDFTVEIGYWNGTDFVPGGPEGTVSYRLGRQVHYFASSAEAMGIPGGASLAIRLTVNNHHLHRFVTGAARSYITAPMGSGEYIDYDSTLEIPDLRISHVDTQEFDYILLEWDPISGATTYNVYSRDMPYGAFVPEPTGTGINATEWLDFEILPRKFYKVTAED